MSTFAFLEDEFPAIREEADRAATFAARGPKNLVLLFAPCS